MPKLSIEASLDTFTAKFAKSAAFTRAGKQLIPGGYSRNSFNFGPHAVFAASGDGAYVETVDGHRLLDLNNNFTVNVLGHNPASVTSAPQNAIPSGISFGNPSTAEADLAQILIERIPSVERVQFSCSATESCMSAIRIARAHTGRTKVAKFEGGYHGFSDPLHISSHTPPEQAGTDEAPRAVADSGGVPADDVNNLVVLTQNDMTSTERILRANSSDLACLILELQSGAGGLVTLDQEFVQGVRALTKELGIVLIFDETISLRAGYHGLQGVYGVTPDLTVMGKIIGGGLPLGAVGGAAAVMNVLETGKVTISGTHHGHKLSLIAGAACMRALDREAFDKLNAHSARILSELNEWSLARGSSFKVYGKGFSHMAYGYMNAPGLEVRTHRDYWRNVDGAKTQIISLELANRGFFPVHRGELSLSLPMTDDDISSFIDTMKEIVVELEE
ncbi:aspartate aminotransferase family protein [Saccharopolyspora elongata]|uniref:Aminotransferase class III-fold pyridoxal phosphate-dependent enzyme n=1 Tax=Saccharopolyspora elongata TaxID=2530387 RepID=A0A4R4Y3Y5_9PSEU|nr:aminotransferase class III-fold pyridoxal phosphate-dependent enzyme [Saccharopolyspora elongata]TDD39098.1 aminotransferase class III-fold pyridoxal phosphate-dependent enzyme [Saccharopolyspora elongata]